MLGCSGREWHRGERRAAQRAPVVPQRLTDHEWDSYPCTAPGYDPGAAVGSRVPFGLVGAGLLHDDLQHLSIHYMLKSTQVGA